MSYGQQFALNLALSLFTIGLSWYWMGIEFAASCGLAYDPIALTKFIIWSGIFLGAAFVGIEACRRAQRHYDYQWIEAMMPPLFPEGAL